jgi:hypothetical protein
MYCARKTPMNNKPRILLYDLEVSRTVVEGYGNKYDFKVVKVTRHQTLMSYAYKWLGEKKIHFRHLHGYKTYRDFVQSLADIHEGADIAVAHNSRFDDRMSSRFFIKEGIEPPAPFKSIDTLTAARRYFKFQGNSLNELSEYLEIGQKEKITYADIETDFLENPTWSVIKKMERYNKKDVELLEGIYLKMRPFMKNHPNVANYGTPEGCPNCGSPSRDYLHSPQKTNTMTYRSVRCRDCHHPYRERVADKDIQNKPDFVN